MAVLGGGDVGIDSKVDGLLIVATVPELGGDGADNAAITTTAMSSKRIPVRPTNTRLVI